MKHSAQNPVLRHSNWRLYAQNSRQNLQQGLTLVELMVALVLGLVLVGGVLNVFVANREAYRSTENLTRIQENARTGFDFMARDLREAGQTACGTPLVANVIRKAGVIPWWADWNKGTVIGIDGGQDRTDIVAFGTTENARVNGTDAVLVIRAEQQNEKVVTNHDVTSLEMTLQSIDGYTADEVAIACDSTTAAIFQIATVSPSLKSISYDSGFALLNCSDQLGYVSPVSTCPAVTKVFSPGARVAKLVTSFWYVGVAANGQRSLYRTRIIKKTVSGVMTVTTEPEEIVPGVQNLQLEYLTSNGATLASNWVDASDGTTFVGATATATGNWEAGQPNAVVAIRLNMTLQSEENIGTNQQPIQRQLIHVVALRSRDYLF